MNTCLAAVFYDSQAASKTITKAHPHTRRSGSMKIWEMRRMASGIFFAGSNLALNHSEKNITTKHPLEKEI
jgi:hypothetical protein